MPGAINASNSSAEYSLIGIITSAEEFHIVRLLRSLRITFSWQVKTSDFRYASSSF